MHITKGHHYQALAPLHQCVLDALGFENGRGPVFSYEDSDAIMMHSQLAADVIDTLAKGHVQHQTDTMVICLHAIKVFCIR